jgi:hypothetical protein
MLAVVGQPLGDKLIFVALVSTSYVFYSSRVFIIVFTGNFFWNLTRAI